MTVGIGETDGVGDGVGTSKDEVLWKAASKPTGSSILTVLICSCIFGVLYSRSSACVMN